MNRIWQGIGFHSEIPTMKMACEALENIFYFLPLRKTRIKIPVISSFTVELLRSFSLCSFQRTGLKRLPVIDQILL